MTCRFFLVRIRLIKQKSKYCDSSKNKIYAKIYVVYTGVEKEWDYEFKA